MRYLALTNDYSLVVITIDNPLELDDENILEMIPINGGQFAVTDKGNSIYLESGSNRAFEVYNGKINPCWYDKDYKGRIRVYYEKNYESGINFDFAKIGDEVYFDIFENMDKVKLRKKIEDTLRKVATFEQMKMIAKMLNIR